MQQGYYREQAGIAQRACFAASAKSSAAATLSYLLEGHRGMEYKRDV
jgi:hypothetical protein